MSALLPKGTRADPPFRWITQGKVIKTGVPSPLRVWVSTILIKIKPMLT